MLSACRHPKFCEPQVHRGRGHVVHSRCGDIGVLPAPRSRSVPPAQRIGARAHCTGSELVPLLSEWKERGAAESLNSAQGQGLRWPRSILGAGSAGATPPHGPEPSTCFPFALGWKRKHQIHQHCAQPGPAAPGAERAVMTPGLSPNFLILRCTRPRRMPRSGRAGTVAPTSRRGSGSRSHTLRLSSQVNPGFSGGGL